MKCRFENSFMVNVDLTKKMLEYKDNGHESCWSSLRALTTKTDSEFLWPIKSLSFPFSTTNTNLIFSKKFSRKLPDFSNFYKLIPLRSLTSSGKSVNGLHFSVESKWKRMETVETPSNTELTQSGNCGILHFPLTHSSGFSQVSTEASAELPKNNAEFARQFIRSRNLQKEDLKNCQEFILLPKKKKDAIYGQFRHNPEFGGVSQTLKRKKLKAKNENRPFSIGPVVFSLLIVCEGVVLVTSYNFYLMMGLGRPLAMASSVIIETAFMLTSAMNSFKANLLRYSILCLGLFSICYSTYRSDEGLKSLRRNMISEIKLATSKIKNQENRLQKLFSEKEDLMKTMNVYRDHGLVTKGLKNLAADKARIAKQIFSVQNIKEKSIGELRRLKSKQTNSGDFSIEAIKSVQVKTWAMIFAFVLIQFISVFFSKLFFNSNRLGLFQRAKLW